jgi:hypothetical protein
VTNKAVDDASTGSSGSPLDQTETATDVPMATDNHQDGHGAGDGDCVTVGDALSDSDDSLSPAAAYTDRSTSRKQAPPIGHTPAKHRPDVMIIGDSNVRHIRPNGLVFGKKVVHVELENKTLRGARNFVKNMKTSPRELIIQCGGNDASRNNIQTIIKDTKDLIRTTSETLPDTGLTIATVFHTDVPTPKAVSLDKQLNTVCKQLNVNYVSLLDICLAKDTFTDIRHLNRNGLTRVVTLYKTVLYPLFGLQYEPYQPHARQQQQRASDVSDDHDYQHGRHSYTPSPRKNFTQSWTTPNRFEPLTVFETMV